MNLILIEKYIQRITKEDVYKYTYSQGINLNSKELDILYNYLKNNYKTFLRNPIVRPKLLEEIKEQVSLPTANKLEELYYQYKDKI